MERPTCQDSAAKDEWQRKSSRGSFVHLAMLLEADGHGTMATEATLLPQQYDEQCSYC